MAKQIQLTTVITQIIKDGPVKPTSPMFSFYCDSWYDVKIDGLTLQNGQQFGVNADTIVAETIKNGISVTNQTEYFIQFKYPLGYKSLQLIETFVKLVDV